MIRRNFLQAAAVPLLAPIPKLGEIPSEWSIRFELPDGAVLAEHPVPDMGTFRVPDPVFIDGALYTTHGLFVEDPEATVLRVPCRKVERPNV